MKKIILSVFLIAALANFATAQNLRLNGYAGYAFDDGIDSYTNSTTYYNGTIEGGFQWGAGIEFMVRPTMGIEFKYLHQDANAPFTYYNNGIKNQNFDLGLNYYLLEFNNYFQLSNEKIEPFIGAGLGMLAINAKSGGQSGNRTSFAWNIKGGTNIWLSQKVGIKLQAELLSASAATGGAYFWSYWGPVYANTYTSLFQFDLGGGLVFKLGK